MTEKIAMLGGTFDPIHVGHTSLALHFARLLELDRVLLIPTHIPPHKGGAFAKDSERLAMCRLAAQDEKKLEVSDIELRREGRSYSYDTVCMLQKLYPEAQLYLIIGADMFLSLETWYKYDKLRELVIFCTVPRDDISCEMLREKARLLEAGGARTIISGEMMADISSTEIRNAVACGNDIGANVCERVKRYIISHRLYLPEECRGELTGTERNFYTDFIRKRLGNEKRFIHSVNVSKEAVRLALKYGADVYKAELAGLLHDAMKTAETKEQIAAIRQSGIEPDKALLASEQVLHGHAAAAIAQTELYIEDEDILNALRFHTSGRAKMSLLEKVIYVADYTSAERNYKDVDDMRRAVEQSLEAAMLIALRFTVDKLGKKGVFVHPDTLEALDEIAAMQ